MSNTLNILSCLNEDYYKIVANNETSYELNIGEREKKEISLLCDANNSSNLSLNVDLKDSSSLKLTLVLFNLNNQSNITFNLSSYSNLELYVAELLNNNLESNISINLNGESALANVYYYSNSYSNYVNKGDLKLNHNYKNTTSNANIVYLGYGESVIKKNAISTINRGMDNSSSNESIKGVLLSEKSKIEAKPILVIDNDDVKASHGCAIGTIDDNEVYYLMSRGLTKDDAMRIITESFIRPVIDSSLSEKFKELINPILIESLGE